MVTARIPALTNSLRPGQPRRALGHLSVGKKHGSPDLGPDRRKRDPPTHVTRHGNGRPASRRHWPVAAPSSGSGSGRLGSRVYLAWLWLYSALALVYSPPMALPDGTFTTACPRNCYSTCSMRVFVEGGRVRRIESHPDNLATPRGICLKGQSYVERLFSPDRLLAPACGARRHARVRSHLVGRGARHDRREAPAFPRERRPQSVLYYTGERHQGSPEPRRREFWRLFGGCTTTYGDLCWPAGLEATRLTLGANDA